MAALGCNLNDVSRSLIFHGNTVFPFWYTICSRFNAAGLFDSIGNTSNFIELTLKAESLFACLETCSCGGSDGAAMNTDDHWGLKAKL